MENILKTLPFLKGVPEGGGIKKEILSNSYIFLLGFDKVLDL